MMEGNMMEFWIALAFVFVPSFLAFGLVMWMHVSRLSKGKPITWIMSTHYILCVVFLFGLTWVAPYVVPTPPIKVGFRYSSLFRATKVMQVTNLSKSEQLLLTLRVENAEQNQKKSHTFIVPPWTCVELGSLEMNWVFLTGETYKLSADGYLLWKSGTVP